jgi:hypothetical protein
MLGPAHYQIGHFVDIKGVSKGKGYTGTVRRWNFATQNMSHGNSLSHRAIGSIGHNEEPSRVFRGKKMAGQMGNENVTSYNHRVIGIDTPRSLLYVKGGIPGNAGGLIKIRDAFKLTQKQYLKLHYPTYFPREGEEYVQSLRWDGDAEDPYE